MEKVCPWCGQPSDRGRLKNRTDAGWQLLKWRAPENNLTLSPCSTLRDRLLFYADYVNIIEGSRSFFATNSKSYNTLVITGQDLRIQNPEGYSEPSKQLSLTPTVSTKRPIASQAVSLQCNFSFSAIFKGPCTLSVFTGRVHGCPKWHACSVHTTHGPWTRGVCMVWILIRTFVRQPASSPRLRKWPRIHRQWGPITSNTYNSDVYSKCI